MHVLPRFGAISRVHTSESPYTCSLKKLASIPPLEGAGEGLANLRLASRRFWRASLARIACAKDLVGGAENALG